MFKIYNNFIIPRKLKKSILLIGNFDGLHLGHQRVCNEAKKYKKKLKSKFREWKKLNPKEWKKQKHIIVWWCLQTPVWAINSQF